MYVPHVYAAAELLTLFQGTLGEHVPKTNELPGPGTPAPAPPPKERTNQPATKQNRRAYNHIQSHKQINKGKAGRSSPKLSCMRVRACVRACIAMGAALEAVLVPAQHVEWLCACVHCNGCGSRGGAGTAVLVPAQHVECFPIARIGWVLTYAMLDCCRCSSKNVLQSTGSVG